MNMRVVTGWPRLLNYLKSPTYFVHHPKKMRENVERMLYLLDVDNNFQLIFTDLRFLSNYRKSLLSTPAIPCHKFTKPSKVVHSPTSLIRYCLHYLAAVYEINHSRKTGLCQLKMISSIVVYVKHVLALIRNFFVTDKVSNIRHVYIEPIVFSNSMDAILGKCWT